MTRADTLRDRIVADVAASGFGAHGLHVLAGWDIATHRWTPDGRTEIASVAKGVSVLAAGIAAGEGLLSLDETVPAFLPDVPLGPGVESVTLRHLLSMSSGIDLPWSETMMTDWPDLAAEFLGRPAPARRFQYSNASTYAAMTAVATRIGDPLDYVRPRLFDPLGIADVTWERCPNGRVLAGEGIRLTTDELARIGRLIRDHGVWDGRRLVPAAVIDAMHSDWVPANESPGYAEYALAGWNGPGPAWRLHGAGGQLLLFLDDTVVTVTADDHFAADAFAARVVDVLAAL